MSRGRTPSRPFYPHTTTTTHESQKELALLWYSPVFSSSFLDGLAQSKKNTKHKIVFFFSCCFVPNNKNCFELLLLYKDKWLIRLCHIFCRCWSTFTWAPTGAQWWAITQVEEVVSVAEAAVTRSASIRRWVAVRWVTKIRSPAVLRPTPVWTSRLTICPSIHRRRWYVNKSLPFLIFFFSSLELWLLYNYITVII